MVIYAGLKKAKVDLAEKAGSEVFQPVRLSLETVYRGFESPGRKKVMRESAFVKCKVVAGSTHGGCF
jgi:hypothetical protein